MVSGSAYLLWIHLINSEIHGGGKGGPNTSCCFFVYKKLWSGTGSKFLTNLLFSTFPYPSAPHNCMVKMLLETSTVFLCYNFLSISSYLEVVNDFWRTILYPSQSPINHFLIIQKTTTCKFLRYLLFCNTVIFNYFYF